MSSDLWVVVYDNGLWLHAFGCGIQLHICLCPSWSRILVYHSGLPLWWSTMVMYHFGGLPLRWSFTAVYHWDGLPWWSTIAVVFHCSQLCGGLPRYYSQAVVAMLDCYAVKSLE